MPRASRSTLKQIAEEAGVSINTVSNALRGKTRGIWSSAALRTDRIREIAARLNYVPHASARSMRTGRFGTAAILTGTKFLPIQLMQALHAGLAQRDMHLTFAEIARRKKHEMELLPKFLRELSVDGILTHALIDIPEEVQAQVHQLGVAIVFLNTRGIIDAVYPDEQDAAERLTQALIALGHRRIDFVNTSIGTDALRPGAVWHYSVLDRASGYQRAMAQAGLEPRLHFPREKLPARDSARYLAEVVSRRNCTALVVFEPGQGMQVCSVAMQLGLRLPDDLQIATFAAEDIHYDALPWVVAQSQWERFGNTAVEMLLQKIAQPKETLLSVAIPAGEIRQYDPYRQIDRVLYSPPSQEARTAQPPSQPTPASAGAKEAPAAVRTGRAEQRRVRSERG